MPNLLNGSALLSYADCVAAQSAHWRRKCLLVIAAYFAVRLLGPVQAIYSQIRGPNIRAFCDSLSDSRQHFMHAPSLSCECISLAIMLLSKILVSIFDATQVGVWDFE